MKAHLEMNIPKVTSRLTNRIDSLSQARLDTQVLKDSNYYAPMDTGDLISSGIRGSKIGSGVLTWNAIYAKMQYYEAPNKSKDKNPNARMKWFEVAKANRKKNWVMLANKSYRGM